ncbi:MAG: isopenicillin N synthase family dioxygenase [Acidimicrobiales bacterium]
MSDPILDVDLLAFETGTEADRAAVVDGVMRSLTNGFVYTAHDISENMIDEVYDMLAEFFAAPQAEKDKSHAPGTFGQTGYTGLLVETAAGATLPDWKEMLNWKLTVPEDHPLRREYPYQYTDQVLPEQTVPGIRDALMEFHRRLADIQRRFLRIIAIGVGCAEGFFEEMLRDGPTLSRAIRYPSMADAPSQNHVWADAHGDINLITALPRATAKGLEVETADGWIDAAPPPGHMIINTGMMLERVTNGVVPTGIHRVVADPDNPGERISMVQFCHPTGWTVLNPVASCITPDNPQAFSSVTADAALQQVLWDINLKG